MMSMRDLGVAALAFVVTHFIVDRMLGGAGVLFTVGACVGVGLGLMLADNIQLSFRLRIGRLPDPLEAQAQPEE